MTMTTPIPPHSTTAEVDAAARAAAAAFTVTRSTPAEVRATWLEAVADALDARAEELVGVAAAETNIEPARLRGEVARTTGQLRLFAEVVRDGAYLEVTVDHAVPSATPPRPDLRRLLVPLGPVAVFSASNFPFAFSVAGGDTASALAAGNPVIVKGHGGHPRLSSLTASVVSSALVAAGAPEGVFGHVLGRAAGIELVQHPAVAAVGFTGSTHGGRALFDLAAGRPDPIPFYGELGSINPVIVTPGADRSRADELADGLAQSFQLGLGQLCTKPGIVLVPRGSRLEPALVAAVPQPAAGALLNESIAGAFSTGTRQVAETPNVRLVVGSPSEGLAASAVVAVTDVSTALASPVLLEEHFGPLTVLVEYDSLEKAIAFAESLGGALTATLHSEPGEASPEIVARLVALAGRVLFSGWPTGVAVTWSQNHGGPWPATTSIHTSVGATAIRRFLRPVVYQSAPEALLPPELQEANPLGIPRRIDGALQLGGR